MKNFFKQLEKDRYAIEDFKPRPVRTPTRTLIGSIERIEVYAQRLRQGVEIFHNADNGNCTMEIREFTKAFGRGKP